ncbi:Cytochrome P460 [Tistlia consotensis]|nr:Cytochrome P460 [Tistlia consotensis]
MHHRGATAIAAAVTVVTLFFALVLLLTLGRPSGMVSVPEKAGAISEEQEISGFDALAALSDARAETIYRGIMRQLQDGYAESDDPIVYAYTGWKRLNAAPFRSARHGEVYANVYANPAAAGYGRLAQGEHLPPGAMLIEDSFVVRPGGEIFAGPLFLMEKMSRGAIPRTGDWRYMAISADGRILGLTGTPNEEFVEPCATCHAVTGAKSDGLYVPPPLSGKDAE